MAARSSRKRQARLTFSPLPSSSPATSAYNQQIRDRAAVVSYDSPHSAKRRKVRDAPGIHSFLEPRQLATPEATKNKSQKSSEPKSTFFGSQRTAKRKQITLDDSDENEDEDEGMLPARASRAAAPRQQAPISLLNNNKQSLISQSTRSHARKSSDSSTTSVEPVKRAPGSFISFDQSDSDSEPLPTTPATRRRARAARGDKSSPVQIDSDSDDRPVRSGRRTRQQSSPVQSSSVFDDEDDEDEMPRSSARRIRRARPQSGEEVSKGAADEVVDLSSGEEDEDDDEEPTPKSKRKLTSAEQQELDDDLQNLQSSSPGTLDGRPRSSQRSKHATALEKLKRRRAGKQVVESDQEEDDEEQSNDEVTEVASSSRSMFRPDEDDEGFLEDDDNDTLGVPAGIPLQFTRYATSSARDLFRYAVEWMVQKKLNPAFLMTDEIYTLTFNKLDDEVKGLAGSKFISSAWASQFHFALRARPQIGMQLINRGSAEHFMRNKCDACNRTNHPATWEIQFLGRPYNKTTLDEIAPNDDSDSSSDDDDEEDGGLRDTEGREIPPQSTVFYVGKFCKANAETGHALTHWRWHLYEWVVDYLTAKGHNTAEMIVKRDGWSERKRRKRANKIVDAMEDEGKIKELYHDFKGQIKEARNSKQGRFDNSFE